MNGFDKSWRDYQGPIVPESFKREFARVYETGQPPKKRGKYGAKPTTVDGIRFASQKEARRYSELCLLEKAGEIRNLELQPRFPLKVQRRGELSILAGDTIGTYVADFGYLNRQRERIVEDVKGFRTPLYKWKKKHVEIQYGIAVIEV